MSPVLICTTEALGSPDLTGAPSDLDLRVVTTEQAVELLPEAEALVFWQNDPELVRAHWDRLARLRWIHVTSAGVEKFLFPELRESDVTLTNAQGVFDPSIAEYVLAVVLAHAQKLRVAWDNQLGTRWQKYETELVSGRRVVVYGTGAIGREVARLLRAVGCDVSAVGRTARSGDPDFGVVRAHTELAESVGGADVLVICCPLTEETRGSVDAKVVGRLGEGALVVNVARGQIIVTSDLLAALDSEKLEGAVLDVFDVEPLPANSPLWEHPKVVITPHIAGDDTRWRERANLTILEQLRRWSTGEPLLNVVDKALGFVPSRGA